MKTRLHLGCQGWTYPDWVGVFYPPGAKQEHLLPFYARVFDTVELDNTYYRRPKPTLVRSWAKHTPAGFSFAAKVPREITHENGLKGVRDQMDEFVRVMLLLGEKLGPLLIQMPASFQQDDLTLANLKSFLDECSREVKLAVEFRHPSWHQPRTYEVLRNSNAGLAWTEWRNLPTVHEITADFLYLRWLGKRSDIEKYDRIQIDRTNELTDWEAEIRKAAPEVENMYGYFNNHWAGHSPGSVADLLRRLGQVALDPRDLWPQGEMF